MTKEIYNVTLYLEGGKMVGPGDGGNEFAETARQAAKVFDITPTPPGPLETKGGLPMATAEETEAYLSNQRHDLNYDYNTLDSIRQRLHPDPNGERSSLISLTELGVERTKGWGLLDDEVQDRAQAWADSTRQDLANRIFSSQLSVQDAQLYLNTFEPEDRQAIERSLSSIIRSEMRVPQYRTTLNNHGSEVQISTDRQWLAEWSAYFSQSPAAETQLGQQGENALFRKFQRAKIFGRSALSFLSTDSKLTRFAEYATGVAVSGAAKNIIKELFINTLGGAATGFVGRVAIGGAAGAIVGAGKEFYNQIRGNFRNFAEFEQERRRQLSEATDAGDQDRINELNAQKRHFRERLARFKWTDKQAIGKAAFRGTVFGALGGLAASVALDMWEAGQVSKTLGDAAGGIGHTLGEAAGAAGRTIGDTAGDFGHAVGEVAGNTGQTIGEAAGAVGRTAGDVISNIRDVAGNPNLQYPELAGVPTPGLTEVTGGAAADNLSHTIGDATGGIGHTLGETAEAAGGAGQAAHEAIGQVSETLNPQDASTLATAAEEAKEHALGASASATLTESLPAVEQAIAHAQSALDNFGASIPLATGSNPWEVSAGILKQMGIVNPSPEQIMELDKIICQESGINVPEWGIPGAIDARHLPVGFNLNLTDTVKKIALGIASKK